MKFKVEYKDNPEWNEVIDCYSWSDLMCHIGCSATKIEVIDEEEEKKGVDLTPTQIKSIYLNHAH